MALIKKYYEEIRGILKSNTLKDSLLIFTGNGFEAAMGFLCTILIARCLTPGDYGIIGLFIAFMGLLTQLIDMGLNISLVKFISCNLKIDQSKSRIFEKISFYAKLILSVIVLMALALFSGDIARVMFNKPSVAPYLVFAAIGAFLDTFLGFGFTRIQAYQKFKAYLGTKVLINFLKAALVGALFIIGALNINSVILSFLLTSLLGAVVSNLFNSFNFLKAADYSKKHVLEFFNFSKWLFLSTLSVMFMMRLDIFMLSSMSSMKEVGYYSGAYRIAMFFPLLSSSLMTVLLPKVTSFTKIDQAKAFIRKIFFLFPVIIPLTIIIISFSDIIITRLLGGRYIGSVPIFNILLLGFFIGVFLNPISLLLYTFNRSYLLAFMNLCQLLLNFLLNLYLIPRYAAKGAAVSNLCMSIFGALGIVFCILYYVYIRGGKTDEAAADGSSGI